MNESNKLLLDGRATIKDINTGWVNKDAETKKDGGEPRFVVGPWSEGDSLGTYGVDPVTKTVWAVINFEEDFAVGREISAPECHGKKRARGCAESM